MKPRDPDPVKLFVSLLSAEEGLFTKAVKALVERFGPLDALSEHLDFSSTDYYSDELGSNIKRRVLSFEGLISPEGFPEIKLFSNSLEEGFSKDGRRRINIDPGYIALEKFVLASCKNFSHRIYIGKGVYAEVTLMFREGDFRPLEWTYPDYGTLRPLIFEMRQRYAFQLGRGLKIG